MRYFCNRKHVKNQIFNFAMQLMILNLTKFINIFHASEIQFLIFRQLWPRNLHFFIPTAHIVFSGKKSHISNISIYKHGCSKFHLKTFFHQHFQHNRTLFNRNKDIVIGLYVYLFYSRRNGYFQCPVKLLIKKFMLPLILIL